MTVALGSCLVDPESALLGADCQNLTKALQAQFFQVHGSSPYIHLEEIGPGGLGASRCDAALALRALESRSRNA